MSLLTAEDLEVLFDVSEFATTATFGASSFPVLFAEDYVDEMEIEGTEMEAIARTSDLAAVSKGDTGSIAGRSVKITRIEPNSVGIQRLVLEEI